LALAAGALVVWLVLKRLMHGHSFKPAAAAGPAVEDDPVYARYRAAVEKDTEKLD